MATRMTTLDDAVGGIGLVAANAGSPGVSHRRRAVQCQILRVPSVPFKPC